MDSCRGDHRSRTGLALDFRLVAGLLWLALGAMLTTVLWRLDFIGELSLPVLLVGVFLVARGLSPRRSSA